MHNRPCPGGEIVESVRARMPATPWWAGSVYQGAARFTLKTGSREGLSLPLGVKVRICLQHVFGDDGLDRPHRVHVDDGVHRLTLQRIDDGA